MLITVGALRVNTVLKGNMKAVYPRPLNILS